MKKILSGILSLFLAAGLLCGCISAFAEEDDFIGNMQVVNCNEWVNVRAGGNSSINDVFFFLAISIYILFNNFRYSRL